MKVLIAPDKFKGTLTASEAAAAMAAGVKRYAPDWEVVLLPIADGGEGTASALTRACGGEMIKARASDALLRTVSCEMGLSPDGVTAFIDLSAASGFSHLQPGEANPWRMSSIGTGELIGQAITKRCKRIVVGLGGSATMDCGMGIAHALGVTFMGENEVRLSPIAANLKRVEYISIDALRPQVRHTEILLLTDVDNGLLGEDGAMRYAAQKGLAEADYAKVADGLQHFANLVEAKFGTSSKLPGMGAAGGAALCCVATLGAKMAPGADFVLQALGAPQAISEADIILTGEGHLDATSTRGKATLALARLASAQGKHVAAICGQVSVGDLELRQHGIDLAMSLYDTGVDVASIKQETAAALTARTVECLAELALKLG